MTVYRICRSKYPNNDGEGSRTFGGRWNDKRTPIIDCGATTSLCALEVLANSQGLPAKTVVIAANIPDGLPTLTHASANLPADWNARVAPNSRKDIGTKWTRSKSSLVLSVPSAIVPEERNYLLDPLHADFPKIKFNADAIRVRSKAQDMREGRTKKGCSAVG